MEIYGSIYEFVVESSYIKSTRAGANRASHRRKNRGEAAKSQTHYAMGESAGKQRKRYVDYPSGESKICIINGPGNSSDIYKVLVDFGANYAKVKPTKDR